MFLKNHIPSFSEENIRSLKYRRFKLDFAKTYLSEKKGKKCPQFWNNLENFFSFTPEENFFRVVVDIMTIYSQDNSRNRRLLLITTGRVLISDCFHGKKIHKLLHLLIDVKNMRVIRKFRRLAA